MPAETHTHHDSVDESTVLALIWVLVAAPGDPDEPDAALPVSACGLDDDLAVLRLWDEVSEELAERTVAEPDLADLSSAATLGDLAGVMLREMRVPS
jgi:hypothetical protein